MSSSSGKNWPVTSSSRALFFLLDFDEEWVAAAGDNEAVSDDANESLRTFPLEKESISKVLSSSPLRFSSSAAMLSWVNAAGLGMIGAGSSLNWPAMA